MAVSNGDGIGKITQAWAGADLDDIVNVVIDDVIIVAQRTGTGSTTS